MLLSIALLSLWALVPGIDDWLCLAAFRPGEGGCQAVLKIISCVYVVCVCSVACSFVVFPAYYLNGHLNQS